MSSEQYRNAHHGHHGHCFSCCKLQWTAVSNGRSENSNVEIDNSLSLMYDVRAPVGHLSVIYVHRKQLMSAEQYERNDHHGSARCFPVIPGGLYQMANPKTYNS